MRRRWDCVPIAQIATRVQRPESVDSTKTYRLLGAHWYAKGLYVKDEKLGAEIRASRLLAVRAGDFVYNRLFAWKGSFALAQEEHDGCFVSGEFPCFQLDSERVIPRFLWLYFSREAAWLESLSLSTGSTPTSRNRLKEGQFLKIPVPLPPLDEQRRIVARIDELAALIEEAQELRAKAREDASVLLQAVYNDVVSSAQGGEFPFRELGQIVQRTETRNPSESPDRAFVYVDISSVDTERGLIRAPKDYVGRDAPSRARRVIRTGDVLFSMTRPYLKGIALVPNELDNQICSTGFCVLRPRREDIDPGWLLHSCRSDYMVDQVASKMRGSNYPAVSDKDVRSARIPLPLLDDQRRMAAYLDGLQDQVDELTALQNATQAELDALLPSVLDRAFKGEL